MNRLEGEFTVTIVNVGSKICSDGGNLGAKIAETSRSQTALGKSCNLQNIVIYCTQQRLLWNKEE